MSITFRYRLALALLACLPAAAQKLNYTFLPTGAPSPTPRVDGTIAYDAAERQLWMFGGQDSAPKDDLWAYSLRTKQWRAVETASAPPARFGHTLLLDPVRRRLIVFGGQARGFFSDVWAFDIAAGVWRPLAADEAGPTRRYGHSAIYDPVHDRMVISHGFTNSGRFDDTWAFDLRANTWTNLSPASNRPLRRCLHHATYDSAGRMYLYGGCASGFGACPLGDLWSFDLARNTWTELRASGAPPAREHYGMGFDTSANRLRLFGGAGPALLNDTWEFDAAAVSWQQTPLAGSAPAPRSRHETAYAADLNATFFFGGSTPEGPTNELWMLAPLGFLESFAVVNAFSYRGGGIAPGEIVSIFGTGFGSPPSVTFNQIPAAVLFANAEQLNVHVPIDLAGATDAAVAINGQTVASLPIVTSHPGLAPLVFNSDLTVNSAANPARPGDIVVLFATGEGRNPRIDLRMGEIPAEILFSGPPAGIDGVLQINARIPASVSSGQVPIVLAVGSLSSLPVPVAIR
jgi:uncharacterized protein (TIGR03437 family)